MCPVCGTERVPFPRLPAGLVTGAPLELFPTSPPPQGAPRLRSGTAPAAQACSGLLAGETRRGPLPFDPGDPKQVPPVPPIF